MSEGASRTEVHPGKGLGPGGRGACVARFGWVRPVVLVVVVAAFVVAGLGIAARLAGLTWGLEQPLAFNHRLHLDEVGLDCIDCHRYARSGVRATIPNIEVCGDCHDEAVGESAAELELVEYVVSSEKIPWRKVYRVPAHVYFSHRRHTEIGGLECEECHGPVGERVEPVTRPYRRPTMADCMDCHEESGVANDCVYCHF